MFIDTYAGKVRSDMGAWQAGVRNLVTSFAYGHISGERPSLADLARALRELRVHTSVRTAPLGEGSALAMAADAVFDEAQRAAGEDLRAERLQVALEVTEQGVAENGAVLRQIIALDEAAGMRTARKFVIAAQLRQRPAGVNVQFTVPDAANKRWKSETMAYTVIRGFLVETYTHVFLACLLQRGIDLARVKSGDEWVTFSISGRTKGHLALADVEHLIHPNLTEMVEAA